MTTPTLSRDEAERVSIGHLKQGAEAFLLRSGKLRYQGTVVAVRKEGGSAGYTLTLLLEGREYRTWGGSATMYYVPKAAPAASAIDAQMDSFLDRQASARRLEEAREDYEAARTPAVLAGLNMVRHEGGTMAADPAPGPGYGPQPCKIATLVAWAHVRGSHAVQAEFDRYAEASDRLAKISTGQEVA